MLVKPFDFHGSHVKQNYLFYLSETLLQMGYRLNALVILRIPLHTIYYFFSFVACVQELQVHCSTNSFPSSDTSPDISSSHPLPK